MIQEQRDVTQAQVLASLIQRSGSIGMNTASIQRSHRFPLHIFIQIENMARMAELSVSTIINQLLEAGIEAVHLNLSEAEILETRMTTQEQIDRPMKTLKVAFNPIEKKAKK